MLDIPIAGPSALCQTLAFNKILTRAKLSHEGVKLPPGCNIRFEDKDNLNKILKQFKDNNFTFPVIVKAPCEDDSIGICVVKEEENLLEAVNHSFTFQYKKEILIEKFIPGREIRTAVIQDENEKLIMLPVCEYVMEPSRIREYKHKFYELKAKTGEEVEILERVIWDPTQNMQNIKRLTDISFECFKGLGVTDWAVFDFRLNTEENEFYFIEAGLFVHFSIPCNIGKLARDIGITTEQHIDIAYNNAIKRSNAKK